ncbi:glycosyltransferase involved in cell wall biosynthesis [Thiogranum longum]|uniref:Glycosyltransferase involved in cell wall biosynthesis n=2 Tax=Thiogranum longum TaxID=1537524 RepID=A0A4R1HC62_9GAMM|nr:glycosyltransferase involved in cell wall biosynthesis [Thiogranum longum]
MQPGESDKTTLDISVIVPLYNEEESLVPLYESIVKSVGGLGLEYEIVFVDDGSKDSTFAMARDLSERDPHLRVIKFRKNYGQTPAMAAGIDHARGRVLITMDGDLQNDPGDIPLFLEKMDEGYDIVVGWRFNRQDKLITRKIPSQIANWLIGKVTGVPIKDNGCSLKAFRANVIKGVPLYSEMHRFIPAMTSLTGARIAEIKVRHHARKFGESKYGLSRIYKVLLDLLTIKTIVSFASRPLLWFAILAIPAALLSVTLLLTSLFGLFSDVGRFSVPIAGTGVLFGALAFFLLMGGAVGELIYKTGDLKLGQLSSLTARFLTRKEGSVSANHNNVQQTEQLD